MGSELGWPAKVHRGLQQINWKIEDHRTGTSAACPVKSLCNHFGNLFNGTGQTAPLRERQREAKDIRFLKRVGADETAAYLAGDAYQGN